MKLPADPTLFHSLTALWPESGSTTGDDLGLPPVEVPPSGWLPHTLDLLDVREAHESNREGPSGEPATTVYMHHHGSGPILIAADYQSFVAAWVTARQFERSTRPFGSVRMS